MFLTCSCCVSQKLKLQTWIHQTLDLKLIFLDFFHQTLGKLTRFTSGFEKRIKSTQVNSFVCFTFIPCGYFCLLFSLVWTLLKSDRTQSEVGDIPGSWSSECLCSFLSGCPRITHKLRFLIQPAGRQQRVAAGSWTGDTSAWVTSGTRWAAAWWLNRRRWDAHTHTNRDTGFWWFIQTPTD